MLPPVAGSREEIEQCNGSRDPQRVCASCAVQLQQHQFEYAAFNANCHRTNNLEDDAVRKPLPQAVRPYANNPFSTTLGSAIRSATFTLQQQYNPLLIPDQKIPLSLISKAEGFVFLTIFRVGIFGGAKFGSGLAVLKREDGTWSAPSAVGMGGAFIGVTFGADIVNLCLVLTSKKACQGLLTKGQLSLEGELGASIGPLGRNASIGALNSDGFAPVYSYAQSSGLLVGLDVNGSFIYTRSRVNNKFYGMPYTADQILRGDVPQPEACYALYETILRLTDTKAYQRAKRSHQERQAPNPTHSTFGANTGQSADQFGTSEEPNPY